MHKAYVQFLGPALEGMSRAPNVNHDAAKKITKPSKGPAGQVGHDLEVLAQHIKPQLALKTGQAFDKMQKATIRITASAYQEIIGVKLGDIGRDLVAIADQFRIQNISLVQNAARDYADSVAEIFGDPSNFGLRVEELAQMLFDKGGVSESRAELIARDQSLKFLGQVNETRQVAAGVDSYVWSTSNDDRVRDDHAILEGETFAWSSPPGPGHPGEDFQCRCVAVPVIPELEGI